MNPFEMGVAVLLALLGVRIVTGLLSRQLEPQVLGVIKAVSAGTKPEEPSFVRILKGAFGQAPRIARLRRAVQIGDMVLMRRPGSGRPLRQAQVSEIKGNRAIFFSPSGQRYRRLLRNIELAA